MATTPKRNLTLVTDKDTLTKTLYNSGMNNLDNAVPDYRKVNGKSLTADIEITFADVFGGLDVIPINMGGTGAKNKNDAVTNLGAAIKYHSSATTEYGPASTYQYGHVLLTDTYKNNPVSNGIAVTSSGITAMYNELRLMPPVAHASEFTTYGVGSATLYGHVKASSAVPLIDGYGYAGTDNGLYAREGHVHPAPIGARGQVYYIEKDGTPTVQLGYILVEGRFVNNTTDLTREMSRAVSFATVFNSWERFRAPGLNGEENSWNYDAVNDQVICTVNSSGYIGFVSDTKHDKYRHEVTLSSDSNDDDGICVVIAYHKDSNGNIYTLSACRTVDGSNGASVVTGVHNWAIIYNLYSDNWGASEASGAKVLFGDNKALNAVVTPGGGWNNNSPTRIRIIRDGDIITCETTPFGNDTNYSSQYKFTINLASDPLLSVFRGPKQYGYGCLSQPNSTFSNVVFSDVASSIADFSTGKVYVYQGGAWSVDSLQSAIGLVGVGRIAVNTNTEKMFFVKDANTVIQISPKEVVPINHSHLTSRYGVGTPTLYGHLKISDNYITSAGSATEGVAASSLALYNTYTLLDSTKVNRAGDNVTGKITFVRSGGIMETAADTGNHIQIQNSGVGGAYITFHRSGVFAANLGLSTVDNNLRWGGWSAGALSYRVWHEGIFPLNHSSTATTYGIGNATNFGHIKLSDNYTSSAGGASSGVGASSLAVYNTYNTLNTAITNINTNITNNLSQVVKVQNSAPAGATNRLWVNTNNGILYYWNGSAWTPVNAFFPTYGSDPGSPLAGQVWIR